MTFNNTTLATRAPCLTAVSYIVDNLAIADRTESLTATRKFARVLGDEKDQRELSLKEAFKWAREALNAFKVFVE